ncbi:MAG: cell wall-binding protein [Nocardioidaceae bacterium]|nr:cell wall-binding protein [Nocardioidaceae bacterium]NUS50719.1 cell wall-binding protein [Nocardioidaceae bacterium]
MRRLGILLAVLTLAGTGLSTVPAQGATSPLPASLDLPAGTKQVLTVTSDRWSSTRAWLSAWRKRADGWHRVHGPVKVRLGWNGFVRAANRRQSTGTTPAGTFTMPYAFGNRADPGAGLRYRHVDGNDVWPYEPRDPATYNIYQPYQASTSHWRTDYRERLASYGYQYAYAVVLGFNLPGGVHWSKTRHQYVASDRADTGRGGGIFLHVQKTRYTAGCVAGPLKHIRWVVRWLDPSLKPRIAMGPRAWVKRAL